MARYDERGGRDFGGESRDRWQDDERERSSWRSGSQGPGERDDERGFFQRAGDEIRSWFNEEDDDDRRSDRDYDRGSYGTRSSWDRDNYSRSGEGWSSSSSNRDRGSGYARDRSHGYSGRSGSTYEDENRSFFGGMAQGGGVRHSGGGSSWDRERDQGFASQRGSGSPNRSSGRDRSGPSSKSFGGFRDESDFRGQHRRNHPQSWGEANRGDNESLGYGEFRGTLGGFGNQAFGSSQDDHYRSWRDRQLSQLDNDYQDYCREREQQFHSDFDSWRRNRQGRSPSAASGSSSSDLGAAGNAGVGTTTSSMTGTAGAGSEAGSATTQSGSMQTGTTVSSDTADAGPSGSSRSGSRSRS